MKIYKIKNLAILFFSLFVFVSFTSIGVAQAKVKHYKVTPVVFGGERAKNVIIEVSAFSCPYCQRTFKKDFDNYLKLVKKKRLKFIYVPAIIHGVIDVKANQIFYLFPKDKQEAMMRLLFNTRETWMAPAETLPDKPTEAQEKLAMKKIIASMVKIVEDNTGLSSKIIYAALKDDAYAQEIVKMNDDYFKMYKLTYTPSYILNGKFIGGSTSYDKVLKSLK